MAPYIAVGKCIFCNEEFPQNLLSTHIKKHLKERSKTNKPGISYLVKIVGDPKWVSNGYFVIIWVNGHSTMEKIDFFLRDIWLECCGHMSDFTYTETPKQKRVRRDAGNDEFEDEITITTKAKTILSKGMKLNYDYDYGSTTKLQLTVLEKYPVKADLNILLVSRNEPLPVLCDECGKCQAIKICAACINAYKSAFCTDCAQAHAEDCAEFAEGAFMPVVNSPRMGVCGYEGGTVDTERDGIFVEK